MASMLISWTVTLDIHINTQAITVRSRERALPLHNQAQLGDGNQRSEYLSMEWYLLSPVEVWRLDADGCGMFRPVWFRPHGAFDGERWEWEDVCGWLG